MKRKKLWGMVVLLALIFGGGYWWWARSRSNTGTVRYVTATVEKGTITTSISGSGNVIVDQLATVDPTVSGTVANLSVSVGDAVKKDQLLFTIENDQLDVSLANSRASLTQAENAVVSANIAKDQAREAFNTLSGGTALNRNILKQKIAAARRGIVAAEQDLLASKLSYRKALDDAAKRRVVSPIDGTVNEINIKNGDDLGSNSSSSSKVAPMILGDLKTLKAQVSVNDVDISRVVLGQKVILALDALEGVPLSGKVEKIDALGTVSQGVVSYNVTIDFDTLDPNLKPDMSVTASIITNVKQDVIVVPNGAVKSSNGSSYVEVLNGTRQTPERKTVEIGVANATSTEIVSGVSVGDKVVTQTISSNAATTTSSSSSNRGGFGLPGLGGRRD